MLTDTSVDLDGTPVEIDVGKQMALYRVDGPLRVRAQTSGIYADTWSGPEVTRTTFGCNGGTLVVDLRSDTNLHARPVRVTSGDAAAVVPANDVGHDDPRAAAPGGRTVRHALHGVPDGDPEPVGPARARRPLRPVHRPALRIVFDV